MSKANKIQIGGDHYKNGGEEHWDRVFRLGLDYFQAAITKYVERWKLKNGVEDLKKARHFLDKYIELHDPVEKAGQPLDLTSAEATISSLQESGVRVVRISKELMVDDAVATAARETFSLSDDEFMFGEIMPTGWTQFVFEGATQQGYLFTCKTCGEKFFVPPDRNPHRYHGCRNLAEDAASVHEAAEASSAYVNQG